MVRYCTVEIQALPYSRAGEVVGFVYSHPFALHCPRWPRPLHVTRSQMHLPWAHRRLSSSGPCKPRRPLFTLQPNGYAKLPFMCHRHDRHKRPRLLSSRRRTQACCSGTRELAWLLSLCSRRETCPLPLLLPLRKVSCHLGRPFALCSAMAARIMSSPHDKARVLHMQRR